ncbi:hypothetical protein L1987_02505 [Smallanthus sonchifolius]|uniref:Uncharacterized protein n=1 Tax=Smallanthus sonchifolius TaxID=185202 RepID=A0ACB9K804_9ASTR|nr:hypothetical protein L1987_02505 [Smallanthus sonchifolius]
MAVEASHITLFPPPNMEMIYHSDGSAYDNRLQTAYGNKPEKILPVYGFGMPDSFPAPVFKAEYGLTSNLPICRKRLRDSSSFNPPFSLPNAPIANPNQQQFGAYALEFLTDDISSQMYQQQLEIDRFISHHTEKVRTEIGEMRRRNSSRLAAAYEGIMNKLKTKDDEILKIGQLNRSLEEKVKSITVENQIWRELAQTNEATANALRNNLQQVLTEIQLQQQQQQHRLDLADGGDDAQSQCGSNFEEDHRQVVDDGGGERKVNNPKDESEYCKRSSRYGRLNRRCRNCGEEESCVLLLPCRHLCVCNRCVSSIDICPVCNSTKSAGVHVNMS